MSHERRPPKRRVISNTAHNGEYSPAAAQKLADPRVAIWLLEAGVLSASESTVDYDSLVNSPSLFPFQIGRVNPEQLMVSGRLDVVRHGLESALVRVRPPVRPFRGVRVVPLLIGDDRWSVNQSPSIATPAAPVTWAGSLPCDVRFR
jgi:hypothetical protein